MTNNPLKKNIMELSKALKAFNNKIVSVLNHQLRFAVNSKTCLIDNKATLHVFEWFKS